MCTGLVDAWSASIMLECRCWFPLSKWPNTTNEPTGFVGWNLIVWQNPWCSPWVMVQPQTQIVEIYEPFTPKSGEFYRCHRLTITIRYRPLPSITIHYHPLPSITIHFHPLPSITILYLSFDVHIFTVQITTSFPGHGGHDPVLAGAVHVIRQPLQGVGGGFLVVGIHLSSWIETQIKDIYIGIHEL